jgi:hypothetical protein
MSSPKEKEIKQIIVNFEKKSKEKRPEFDTEPEPPKPKQPTKRIITTKQHWDFTEEELATEKQFNYIKQLTSYDLSTATKREQQAHKIIIQQIKQKLYGYKSQDLEKNKYSEADFVNIETILNKMMECENKCFYCKNQVHVLYEFVREPKQWTVERIDNDFGHNRNNIVIACLSCNLHRRTMYHERYVFTKQLVITKL